MWIPRLSVLSLLIIMSVCGLYFAVLALAARGNAIAIAVSATIGSLILAAFVYGLTFLAALLLTTLFGLARPRTRASSPFATETPPPQIIPPSGE